MRHRVLRQHGAAGAGRRQSKRGRKSAKTRTSTSSLPGNCVLPDPSEMRVHEQAPWKNVSPYEASLTNATFLRLKLSAIYEKQFGIDWENS